MAFQGGQVGVAAFRIRPAPDPAWRRRVRRRGPRLIGLRRSAGVPVARASPDDRSTLMEMMMDSAARLVAVIQR